MASKNTPAGTALGPMFIAANEQYLPKDKRIVDDALAAAVMPGSARFYFKLCRWTPFRSMIAGMTENVGPGLWNYMLCRKRFFDDKITEAVADGIEAVVVLGAGLDTRSSRIAVPNRVPAFEVDLPENIATKKSTLEGALGQVPEGLHLVAVDFERDDLMQTLVAHGYDPNWRTLFLWEGVTQYLTEPAVKKTLEFLAKAAPGSKLGFTYVLADFIDGTAMHGAEKLYKRFVKGYGIWKYGIAPDKVADFLAPYGWTLTERFTAPDGKSRYFDPIGRRGNLTEIEEIACAEKRQ